MKWKKIAVAACLTILTFVVANGMGEVLSAVAEELGITEMISSITTPTDDIATVAEEADINAVADSDIVSGTCGTSATWTLDRSTGILEINGKGGMNIYDEIQEGMYDAIVHPPWYSYKSSIKEIVIEEGIESIGDFAFYQLPYLTMITIPASVTSVGERAFEECSRLTRVEIVTRSTFTIIYEYAFANCAKLNTVIMPEEGSFSFYEDVFANCTSLRQINIPARASVRDYLFSNCTALETVVLPSRITEIPKGFFAGCSKLQNIEIPSNVTTINSYAFKNCSSLTQIKIPNGVTTIGDEAFKGCSGLTSIEIPSNVTTLGDYLLSGCSGLTDVKLPLTLTEIPTGMFQDCKSLTQITMPASITELNASAFAGCSDLQSIEIPTSVTFIGRDVFNGCSNLTEITIPENVTRIESEAFANCENLKKVKIYSSTVRLHYNPFTNSDKVILIGYEGSTVDTYARNYRRSFLILGEGEDATGGCGYRVYYVLDEEGTLTIKGTGRMNGYSYEQDAPWYSERHNIRKIIISSGIEVGSKAFTGCNNLEEVQIEDGATEIASKAFANCSNLQVVKIYSSEVVYSEDVFTNSTSKLTLIGYEGSTTDVYAEKNNIRFATFEEMEKSDGVCGYKVYYTLDDNGVLTIKGSGDIFDFAGENFVPWYQDRDKITKVVFSSYIDRIPNYSFAGCCNLTDIEGIEYVENIGSHAFANCTSLVEFEFPQYITTIEDYAFKGCTSLSRINLAQTNLSDIGNYAFSNCSNLVELDIWAEDNIGDGAFQNCINLKTVSFHWNYIAFGTDVFGNIENSVILVGNANSSISTYAKNNAIRFGTYDEIKTVDGVCGHRVYYTLASEGVLDITGNGTMNNFSNDYPAPWYLDRERINKIKITDGVSTIGNLAFIGCKNVDEIEISANVTYIGEKAFADCEKLRLAKIYTLEATLGADVFENIEDTVVVYAHQDSTMQTYTKPYNIQFGTFEMLQKVNGVCGHEIYYTIDSNGTLFISGEGNIHDYKNAYPAPWYSERERITEIIISNEISCIGNYAFSGCIVNSVIIPTDVTHIGQHAFDGCLDRAIVYNCDAVIDDYAFTMSETGVLVGFPNSTTMEYAQNNNITFEALPEVDGRCGETVFYKLIDSGFLMIIGRGDMYDYDVENTAPWYDKRNDIVDVLFENTVTNIGDYAFYDSDNLKSVVIPNHIISIGKFAFSDCTNIQTVEFESKTTVIEEKAFEPNLWKLTFVGEEQSTANDYALENKIPFRTRMELQEFDGICGLYANYTINDEGTLTIYGMGEICTYSNSDEQWIPWEEQAGDIKKIIIPEGITRIGDCAFKGCEKVTEIIIPKSVTEIGQDAFSGCKRLMELAISENVNLIGKGAFSDCLGLEMITILSSTVTIEENAFEANGWKRLIVSSDNSTAEEFASQNNILFCTFEEQDNYDGICGKEAFYVLDKNGVLTISGTGEICQYAGSDEKWVPWESQLGDIREIIISEGITQIGKEAFKNCAELQVARIYATEIVIDESSFAPNLWKFVLMGKEDSTVRMYANEQLIPFLSFEDEEVADGICGLNAYYKVDESGNLIISGTGDICVYPNSEAEWIPWKEDIQRITNITIPEGITGIGKSAFDGCVNVKEVVIPKSVKQLSENSFKSNLWNLVLIGEKNSIVEQYAGENNIPFLSFEEKENSDGICGLNAYYKLDKEGVLTIVGEGGICCFENYDGEWIPWAERAKEIKKVVIPKEIIKIGNRAFAQCTEIQCIEIENSTVLISDDAIKSNLWNLYLVGEKDSTTERYAKQHNIPFVTFEEHETMDGICGLDAHYTLNENGILTIYGTNGICTYPNSSEVWVPWENELDSIKEVIVPEAITEIGASAFKGASNLQCIKISGKETIIGADALEANGWKLILVGNDGSLAQTYAQEKLIPFITFSDLENTNGVCGLTATYKLTQDGTLTINGSGAICAYPNSDEIWVPWIERTSEIKKIIISEDITEIGAFAFADCKIEASVIMPKHVSRIEDNSFKSNGLKFVLVGEEDSVVEQYAIKKAIPFMNYEDMLVWDGVCGLNAYYKLDAEGVLTISGAGFIGGDLSSGQKWIPWSDRTEQINEIIISEEITTINNSTFANCINVSEVNLPSSVTEIGSGTFENCTNLKVIKIHNPEMVIGENAIESNFWNLILVGEKGSTAEIYAKSHDISFVTFETYDSMSGICGVQAIYELNEDGTLEISGSGAICTYPGSDEKWVPWSEQISQIKKVVLGEDITEIGSLAFAGCSNLKEIEIPQKVAKIGQSAFSNCTNLSVVKIHSATVELGDAVFEPNLWNLIFVGQKNSTAQSYAKENNIPFMTFEEYEANDGVCGLTAYYRLDDNGTLTIYGTGDICTYPGYDDMWVPWYGVRKQIQKVVIGEAITGIGKYAFEGCSSLRSVMLPANIASVGERAFSGCSVLESATIYSSSATFGNRAFVANDLLSISGFFGSTAHDYALANSIPFIALDAVDGKCGENVFYRITEDGTLIINGTGAMSDAEQAPWYGRRNEIKRIIIQEGVTTIGKNAFTDCNQAESIQIAKSVVKIGEKAFYGCSKLYEITLPDGITEIADYTFYGCSSLEEMVLPASVTRIGISAFENCENLKMIHVPEGVVSIEDSTFAWCSSLTSITLPESVTSIGKSAFSWCDSLANITLGSKVESIGNNAFRSCDELKKVRLPESVEQVGENAFAYCSSLEHVAVMNDGIQFAENTFNQSPSVVLFGNSGSTAESYAASQGLSFHAGMIPTQGIALVGGSNYIVLDSGETYYAEFETDPENTTDVISLTTDNHNVAINGHYIYAQRSGDAVITATASSGVTYQFTIHVRSAVGLSVVTPPAKLEYELGEELDLTGMLVNVVYDDESVKEVTDYEVSEFDSSTEGDKALDLKWTAADGSVLTTSLLVKVIDLATKVTAIHVETLPLKTVYELRESLDLSGMVVMATYGDYSVAEVTDYEVSGYNSLKNAIQTITITYEGYTATFNVTVGNPLIMLGDLSGDKMITIADVELISAYDAGLTTLTAEQLVAGDVNYDGIVDAGDAVVLKMYIAGKIAEIK